jgi:diguanylate cyclase
MSQASDSLQRLTLLLAWVVSALIAVVAPAAYFLLAQQGLQKSLESQAELTITSINGIILSNPKMWRFEEVRLSELLDRRAHDAVPQG